MKLLTLILLIVSSHSWATAETYYKITKAGRHIGYQTRDLSRVENVTKLQYTMSMNNTLFVVSSDSDDQFNAINFVASEVDGLKTVRISGRVHEGRFTKVIGGPGEESKSFRPVPAGTVLNNLLPLALVKKVGQIKVGTKADFPVIIDMSGKLANYKLNVIGEAVVAGIKTFRVAMDVTEDNVTSKEYFNMTTTGELIRLEVPEDELVFQKVATLKEADGSKK